MPRPITAILIDPYARTATEVTHDANDYREIYKLLSGEPHDVDTFCAAYPDDLTGGDALFVDDNGLLSNDERRRPFMWRGYAQPLMGRALVLGSNGAGDTVAPKVTLEQVRERVTFAPGCFRPKGDDTARLAKVREAITQLMREGTDENIDEFAMIVAMGRGVQRMHETLAEGRNFLADLGMGEQAQSVTAAEVQHKGRNFRLTIMDLGPVEAGPKPEPEVAERSTVQ